MRRKAVPPPEKSSPQPDMETKLEPEPKPNQAGDDLDPVKSIKKIRTIVEALNTLFPPQLANLTKSAEHSYPFPSPLRSYTMSIPEPSYYDESENSIHKLKRNLRLLEENVAKLNEVVGEEVSRHIVTLDKMLQKLNKGRSFASKFYLTKGMKKDLEDVNKKIFNLMCQVPLLHKRNRKPSGLDSKDDEVDNNGKGIQCLSAIHVNEEDLKRLAIFRQVKEKFIELGTDRKICLLSFAVFPENQEVNRTMLMYWWIGEGILHDGVKPEDAVKEILKEFMEKKLIEPVENKRKVEPNCYKMTPFVHSSVVLISKEIGLFSMHQKGGKPRMKKSELDKVCLVDGSSSQPEAKGKKLPARYIETVINVSERFPDFTCKWFSSKTKTLKVLYLGRWERTEREIEVDSRRVMKALSCMSKLRFLSLQGISTIKILSRSACKLTKLIILDLRGCYSLEKLPDDIHKLKSLIYLDLTGCEALERIPTGLARLTNLEVLKGFVVTDDREIACKLIELKRLVMLRKLSVTVDGDDFGCEELLEAVEGFDALEKLKVRWRSGYSLVSKKQRVATRRLPRRLKKLDLRRFPDSKLPECLLPQNLLSLEKLHLGSSRRLKGFGALPETPTECGVTVLHLMCLPKLRVEFKELRKLYFPKLRFLESYECPKVTFCLCDADGIWRSDD